MYLLCPFAAGARPQTSVSAAPTSATALLTRALLYFWPCTAHKNARHDRMWVLVSCSFWTCGVWWRDAQHISFACDRESRSHSLSHSVTALHWLKSGNHLLNSLDLGVQYDHEQWAVRSNARFLPFCDVTVWFQEQDQIKQVTAWHLFCFSRQQLPYPWLQLSLLKSNHGETREVLLWTKNPSYNCLFKRSTAGVCGECSLALQRKPSDWPFHGGTVVLAS